MGMLNLRQTVIISKHWHTPEIMVSISDEGIALECSLDDFILALLSEVQHPMKHITLARQHDDVQRAKTVVLEKLKEASTYAV